MFFGQISNSAVERATVRSVVNHEPFATADNTETVSRTRDSVSSVVSSKKGPRSLIMRGTIANSVSEIYSAKLGKQKVSTKDLQGPNDELLNGLDRGHFERNLSFVRLEHLYGSFEILPANVRRKQFCESTGQKQAATLQKWIGYVLTIRYLRSYRRNHATDLKA